MGKDPATRTATVIHAEAAGHEVRLPIAGASAAVEMHPQTLRKYERAGLLHPARREGGSRHYSADDLARLALIKHLAEEQRINVAGMAMVLALHDEIETLASELGDGDQLDGAAVRERLQALLERISNGSAPAARCYRGLDNVLP